MQSAHNARMMKAAVLILALASLTTGCAAHNGDATPAESPTSPPSTTAPSTAMPETITVTGTITNEGVECLAMRGDDGKLYTLGRPKNPPAAGQRVRVTGTIAEMSFCMQGTTISVRELTPLP